MEKRTVGMISTGIAVLLCGCPGLIGFCFGSMFAMISFMPGAEIKNFDGSSDPTTALITGLSTCCFGILFIAIPIAVGFFTLRKQAEDGSAPISDEPPSAM